MTDFDYDWLVIGSGFGGSVSALRLAEKGYSVACSSAGAAFATRTSPSAPRTSAATTGLPHLGMRGILRLSIFKDVFVLSGCGVGGGSLGYANTLYRARPGFYDNPQWSGLADWAARARAVLRARQSGCSASTDYDRDGVADVLLREYGESIGVGASYKRTPVGVFLGEPGETVPDPYFGGEGPERTGCTRCGSCMIGCRYGAKNTLVKNYLWFAEKLGVQIHAGAHRRPTSGRSATEPAPTATRSRTSARAGSFARQRRTLRARGVIVAAGALGTNRLLQRCKLSGSLPRLSDRLGYTVRTNSEAIISVCAPEGSGYDFSDSVAITSSIHTDPDTHIEVVTYGTGGDSQSLLRQLMVTAGRRGTRPFHFALAARAAPARGARRAQDQGDLAALDHPAGDAVARQLDAAEGQAPAAERRA